MKLIKLGIISILFFALLITIFSLFFPSHIRVSKAIDIAAAPEQVRAQLADPQNWKNWYPGADSAELVMQDGRVAGFKTKAGTSLLLGAVTDSTVMAEQQGGPFRKGRTGWYILPGRTPNTCTLQWYNDFYLRWYPWEKFSGILLENRYGPMMEQGLAKLKKLLEN